MIEADINFDADAADTSPTALATLLFGIIAGDQERLARIDDYVEGRHPTPYMPVGADQEYKLLAQRSISNWIPLLVNTPLQSCYVDSFRPGNGNEEPSKDLPEWKHWQLSRLDSRQISVHQGALKYGHSFTLTETNKRGKVVTKGLSATVTAAVYEDAANDIIPYAALTIERQPDAKRKTAGLARMWVGPLVYDIRFQSLLDMDTAQIGPARGHGASDTPVTRFVANLDLEGRTTGVVEPNMCVQDRLNQTMFDLLIVQTYGAFNVRTITGMAPPVKKWTQQAIDAGLAPEGAEPGDVMLDATGSPIPRPISLAASRLMFAENEKAKFDSLPATALDGYISALDMSIRHLAAMSQTPPHYLLGQIANLSAEAITAAETTLLRKVEAYRKNFGESWERVFQLAGELEGTLESSEDFAGEVVWRDTEMRSLSGTADALSKFKEIGVPLEALQAMIPGSTRGMIENWISKRAEDMKFRTQLAEIDQIANAQMVEEDPAGSPAAKTPEAQPAAAAV